MGRRARFAIFCGAALICLATALPASACPMCKLATETTTRQPRAYMYSILFMMSMPATIMTGFGIAFFRLSRKAARMHEEATAAYYAEHGMEPPTTDSTPNDPTPNAG